MPLKQAEVTSPDGHIRLAFALDGNNSMTYQVSVGDTVFITPSLLGFTAKDGVNLAEGCLLYTSPSPQDTERSRMPSSA